MLRLKTIFNKLLRILSAIPPSVYVLAGFSVIAYLFSAVIEFFFAGFLQAYSYHLGFVSREKVLPVFQFLTVNEIYALLFLGGIEVVRAVIQFMATYSNLVMAETYVFEARRKIVGGVFDRQDLTCKSSGEITNILSEVIPKSGMFVTSCVKFVAVAIEALLILAFCFFIAYKETLCIVLLLGLCLPLIRYFNRISGKLGKEMLIQMNNVTAELLQSVRNIHFLKIIGKEKEQKNKVVGHCAEYLGHYLKFSKVYGMSVVFPGVYGLMMVIVLISISRFVWHTPPIAMITLFYMLLRFMQAISQSFAITNGLSMYFPSFLYMIEEEARQQDRGYGNLPKTKSIATHKIAKDSLSSVEAKNLSFRFSGDRNSSLIFENISFRTVKGKCLVFQGPSGVGKSTLLYTILGLYKPIGGQVLWGDVPLEQLSYDEVRQYVSYVGPQSFIKAGTIYENISYGLNENPTNEELIDACRRADVLDFIFASSMKWDTRLSENGDGLSEGQKQRLGFARAYLRKPRILILDESTSNLDSETELKIVDNLCELKNNMIIIAASHRDAILEIADEKMILQPPGKKA